MPPASSPGACYATASPRRATASRMALWAGAELEAGGAGMIWNRGIVFDDTGSSTAPTRAYDIFLPAASRSSTWNANGERSMNEDQCYPLMSYAGGANQPGHFSWIVWDGYCTRDIERFDTCGCSRLSSRRRAPRSTPTCTTAGGPSRRSTSTRSGWSRASRARRAEEVRQAHELAKAMKFDADQTTATFKATIERYNRTLVAAQAGRRTSAAHRP